MSRPNSQNKCHAYVNGIINPDSTLGEMFANEGIADGMGNAEEYHTKKLLEEFLDAYSLLSPSEYVEIESSNIKGSATLEEHLINERTPFKEHHGHETMENNQVSAYQQRLFDSTSSVNVPTMADERSPISNPYCQESLTEQLEIEKNIPMETAILEEGLLDNLMTLTEPDGLEIMENNEASANQHQWLAVPSSLNTPIPSDKMLVNRNSDQVLGHTNSLVHYMKNNGMHDGTSNANFLIPFTDQQHIGSNENTQEHRDNLEHGNTSSHILQMEYFESIQGSYQYLQMDFNFESSRLLSFRSIKISASKTNLARYGFYYNQEYDHVKCCFCQVVLGNWNIGDDPFIEHLKHSPNCNFINLRCTANVPSDEDTLNKELPELFKCMSLNPASVPRHPDYRDINARLQSFKEWPIAMPITKEDLNQAGFFYSEIGDRVKCFHCGGCLYDWEKGESPIEEHYRHFAVKCQFIKDNYSILKRNARKNINKGKNATPEQLKRMEVYMDKHPDLKDGPLYITNKVQYNHLWDELTKELNRLGPEKTVEGWKKDFRNWKFNKKRKTRTNQTS